MNKRHISSAARQSLTITISIILLILAFVPVLLMLVLSLKTNAQIYGNFWSLPDPVAWDNYGRSFGRLYINMVNTIFVVSAATLMSVALAATSGYVFAKLEFPGKETLFLMILSLMMIPAILTLTPRFKLMETLNLLNTRWVLILNWAAAGQVFGILLCRTFMNEQPNSLFESSRIDGATELQALYLIAVPLARPILTTIGVMNMINFYNDFIWPLIAIDSNLKQVISVAIRSFEASTGTIEIGTMMSGYAFATLPLVLLFMLGSRFYIEGLTAGAIKS
ncbi:MAG: carbohydrate ABC transporter permease [Spirochaetia bacterium]|nr:carbohydrate ABC transporter permease [Spirochaetia bacterium]MCF7941433.1 carbohydrate ABC transporter permease [Spirochaetia bacterium]